MQALAESASGAGDAAARLARTHALARALAQARPSMAAIANTVAHVWWAAARVDGADAQLAALQAAAVDVDARWAAAVEGMTQWARGAVKDAAGGAIYTLSRSGSVERILTVLAHERPSDAPLQVLVGESRPGAEGVALSKALAAAGAQVTLIGDAACAAMIDEAALVMVGADSIRADGSVVNKVGTHTLALVARASEIPVYALAERLKVTPTSYPLVIEEMAPGELLPVPVAGVTARNIVFDVTPAALITSYITELGPFSADDVAQLADEAERAYQSLMR